MDFLENWGFEAHRTLFEFWIRILGYANASNMFLVHQQIENPQNAQNEILEWSKRPWHPHNQIRLEKLLPCPESFLGNRQFVE